MSRTYRALPLRLRLYSDLRIPTNIHREREYIAREFVSIRHMAKPSCVPSAYAEKNPDWYRPRAVENLHEYVFRNRTVYRQRIVAKRISKTIDRRVIRRRNKYCLLRHLYAEGIV